MRKIKTANQKNDACKICGAPTFSASGICAACQRSERKKQFQEEFSRALEQIRLEDLTERQRRAVELRKEGQTYREIAAELGVSVQRAQQIIERVLELPYQVMSAKSQNDIALLAGKILRKNGILERKLLEVKRLEEDLRILLEALQDYQRQFPQYFRDNDEGGKHKS